MKNLSHIFAGINNIPAKAKALGAGLVFGASSLLPFDKAAGQTVASAHNGYSEVKPTAAAVVRDNAVSVTKDKEPKTVENPIENRTGQNSVDLAVEASKYSRQHPDELVMVALMGNEFPYSPEVVYNSLDTKMFADEAEVPLKMFYQVQNTNFSGVVFRAYINGDMKCETSGNKNCFYVQSTLKENAKDFATEVHSNSRSLSFNTLER